MDSAGDSTLLSEALASALARVALANTEREYPRAVAHLMRTPQDELAPKKLHPAFFGSYDWHSAVHMHWLLVRVLRLYPMLPENGRIAALLDAHLSAANLEVELDYLKKNPLFERPYGWAWLLALQAEALRLKARWARALAPLAEHLASRMADFVELPYPIRSGAHFNSAFACILALDYARVAQELPLQFAIVKAAKRWYGTDRDAPLAYEPSLDDFLSPSLVEAVLMKQVLEQNEFARWLNGFLPDGIGPLAEPPMVVDRSDAKQSHLDGLCLSRAWCFNALELPDHAAKHLAAGMPQVVGGNYVGEHWLASFAVLALSSAALRS
jgi:hypothetical protein